MTIFILQNEIKPGSFIPNSLHVRWFSELRIGPRRYVDILRDAVACMDGARVLFADAPMSTVREAHAFLVAHGIDLAAAFEQHTLIYYDLHHVPVQPDVLSTIIDKAVATDAAVTCFRRDPDGRARALPIYKTTSPRFREDLARPDGPIAGGEDAVPIDLTGAVVDLGDPDRVIELFASNFETRFFNTLTREDRYFVKSSSNRDKMRAEYRFFAGVPAALRPYFPQVGDYREGHREDAYQVERITMLDASKLLVNRVLTPERARRFLAVIRGYLDACPRQPAGSAAFREAMRTWFIDKVARRVAETRALPVCAALDHLCSLQGYDSLEGFHAQLAGRVDETLPRLKDTDLVFSHGDLCLSNILYDVNTRQMKLIDPRGYAGDREPYLPAWYDLAKLSHSFLGLYDLIVYDLVDLNLTDRLRFEPRYGLPADYLQGVAAAFGDFVEGLGCDPAVIRLCEATLFLSMLPLHQDNPRRMAAQLVQAMRSFDAAQRKG